MELQGVIDFVAHNGFAIVFAAWALIRLDRFMTTLVENEARETEILNRIVEAVERRVW